MDFLKINLIDLLSKTDSNELVLPNFQRNYVWKTDQQRMLVASFLVGLPIGTFLILEGEKNDFVSKKICFKNQIEPEDNCMYLLDGQQRLSTIKSVFTDLLNFNTWDKVYDDLFSPLRNKWYLDLNEENCQECLGYDKLNFTKVVSNKGINYKAPILSIKEPNDILDAIRFYQVFKSKKENKFHPGRKFRKTSLSDFDKELELAQIFANDLHIPLFDFLTNGKTIIKNTLKQIATNRAESLKNEVIADETNGYAKSIFYLFHLDSNIQDKYKNGNFVEINNIWDQLKERWVEEIIDYFKDIFKAELMVPKIKSNELSRATSVFEYMNKGGTPLDTFDIMVAKTAAVNSQMTLYDQLESILSDDFEISKELSDRADLILYSCKNFGVFTNDILSKQVKELFLNFLSLCIQNNIDGLEVSHIKKDKILSYKKEEIESAIECAGKALKRSIAFLQFRCGIHNINFVSYNLMLVPLGMLLKEDDVWDDRFKINKLEFWYWTSLFSGRFREKQNQRAISETKDLNSWINDNGTGNEIISRKNLIFSESNYSDKPTLLLENEDKSVPTAIHYGIMQYVLSTYPNDFTVNEFKLIPWEISKDGMTIQDHHIIPLGSVSSLGESTKALRINKNNILNSPLNRTFITQKANQDISHMSLDRYIPFLNNSIIHSHCLPDEQINDITGDGFPLQFVTKRFDKIKHSLLTELSRLEA